MQVSTVLHIECITPSVILLAINVFPDYSLRSPGKIFKLLQYTVCASQSQDVLKMVHVQMSEEKVSSMGLENVCRL